MFKTWLQVSFGEYSYASVGLMIYTLCIALKYIIKQVRGVYCMKQMYCLSRQPIFRFFK
jgi:hypothetical protein